MPIYEFRCEECGARFERLVDAGARALECGECGSDRTERVLSAHAAPARLVKGRGERRKQERANASLHESTKARFKQARKRAREKGGRGGIT